MNSEKRIEDSSFKGSPSGEEDSSSEGRRERRGSAARDRRERTPRPKAVGGKKDVSGGELQEKREDGRERRRGSGNSNRRREAGKARENIKKDANSEETSTSREKGQGGRRGRPGQKRNDRPSRAARTNNDAKRRTGNGNRKRDASARNGNKPREELEELGTVDVAEIFKKGKERLKEERLIDACKLFKRAYKLAPDNPEYMSYCGLASATGFGEIKYGLELCTRAIKCDCNIPEFYINLAKVYVASGNKKGAIMAITKGTKYEIGSDTLHQMLIDMGVRKQSILPFMKRSSFINKGLGILFRRMLPVFRNRNKAGK